MKELLIEKDGHVVIITLNRPEKRNAMALAMWQRLGELFVELDSDDSVRAIILTGAAGHFCAGADISEFPKVRNNAQAGKEYDAVADGCEAAIHHCKKPTIAAIDGVCVGGGMGLAVCCDFRIASRGSRFGITAARLGIIYSLAETQILYDVVGASASKRILMSGDIFDSDEANRLGLLQKLVESDALEAAQSFASRLAVNAPLSVLGAKDIISRISAGTAKDDGEAIEKLVLDAFDSNDYIEGQKAFMEKRAPDFLGK